MPNAMEIKTSFSYFITVIFLSVFLGCSPKGFVPLTIKSEKNSKISQTLYINEGLPIILTKFIDEINPKASVRVSYPYQLNFIDTSFYVMEADELRLSLYNNNVQYTFSKIQNRYYDSCIKEIEMAFPHEDNRLFFFDNKDSVVANRTFVNNYLSKNLKKDSLTILNISKRFHLSESTSAAVLFDFLHSRKISSVFSYTNDAFAGLRNTEAYQLRIKAIIGQVDSLTTEQFMRSKIKNEVVSIFFALTSHSVTDVKNISDIRSRLALIEQNLNSETNSFDYLITVLNNIIDRLNIFDNDENLERLRELGKKSKFYFLQKNYEYNHEKDVLYNVKKDKSFYTLNGLSFNLDEILAVNKDQPILLEFWASWCAPCIEQFPKVETYTLKYPNLNLIQISIDSDPNDWKTAIKKYALTEKIGYRVNKENVDLIIGKFQTIPKYGIVRKDGSVNLFDRVEDIDFEKYKREFEN